MVAKAVACDCGFCFVSRTVRDYAKEEFNTAAGEALSKHGLTDAYASRERMSVSLAVIVEAAVGVVINEVMDQLKYSIETAAILDSDGNASENSMNAFSDSVYAVVSGWSKILDEDLGRIVAGILEIDERTGA